jgi:hypothetical protein
MRIGAQGIRRGRLRSGDLGSLQGNRDSENQSCTIYHVFISPGSSLNFQQISKALCARSC